MDHFKKYGVLYAILFVFAMWLLTPSLVNLLAPTTKDQIASRGQFGDMYGYITSLFSGLTIIGLVYTIIQQHEDLRIARESLKEQKKELQLNRDELKETRKEFEQQNTTLKFQRFENTFFQMLNLFYKVSERFSHKDFENLIIDVQKRIHELEVQTKNPTDEQIKKAISPYSKKYYQYLSSFIIFIRWICETKTKDKSRKKYLTILFSFLTHEQRAFFLMFFALSETKPYMIDLYKKKLFVSIDPNQFRGLLKEKCLSLVNNPQVASAPEK